MLPTFGLEADMTGDVADMRENKAAPARRPMLVFRKLRRCIAQSFFKLLMPSGGQHPSAGHRAVAEAIGQGQDGPEAPAGVDAQAQCMAAKVSVAHNFRH